MSSSSMMAAGSAPPEALTIRRAEAEDAHRLAELVDAEAWLKSAGTGSITSAYFEDSFVSEVLPGSLLCVAVEDAQGQIVGFAAFDDRPTRGFASAEQACAAIEMPGADSANTIFLTCWGSQEDISAACLDLCMRTLFDTLPRSDYVVIMCHPRCHDKELFRDMYFDDAGIYDSSDAKDEGAQWLVLCSGRTSWRLNLDTRPAQVEDYDDLVKIFDAQSQILTKTFGEFFLAELIEAQDEDNRAVAATLRGRAVGMMCLTTQVDVGLLQNNFELDAFDNLVASSEVSAENEAAFGSEAKLAERASENVFAISVFCIAEEHRSRTRDVLIAAFESFPGKEYLALTLPCEVHESALLPFFTAIAPRDGTTLSHSLYVLHRDALRVLKAADFELDGAIEAKTGSEGKDDAHVPVPRWVGGSQMRVRVSDMSQLDQSAIASLLDGLEMSEEAQNQAAHSDNQALMVEVLGQLIGLVVLQPGINPDELEKLGQKFHMEAVQGIPTSAAQRRRLRISAVLQMSLLPIFNQFARLILQEVMRQVNVHGLIFQLFPGQLPPVAVVEEMVPLRPRRTFSLQRARKLRHVHEPPEENTRFSLFMLSRAALSEPRLTLNARIVVVGASTAGLSLLEELLTIPHAHFPKLTLIAPGGVADERFDGVRGLCTQGTSAPGAYDSRFLDRLGLRERVTIVEERMLFIEREPQAVVLADGSLLQYDFLVLATGLQDTSLHRLCDVKHAELANSKSLAESAYSVGGNPREAVFLRRAIQAKHVKVKAQTLVYGATLEAYAVVQSLLDWGLPGASITMIHPPDAPCPFSRDTWISERVAQAVEAAGVVVVQGLRLVGVTRDPGTGAVCQASFLKETKAQAEEQSEDIPTGTEGSSSEDPESEESKLEGAASGASAPFEASGSVSTNARVLLRESKEAYETTAPGGEDESLEVMKCRLFITADTKNVDPDIFASVNDTGLVYDGRMVVNSCFQTVDSRIFGCGTNTKFSRRYRAPLTIEHHSSREVGARIAASLLRFVDPLRSSEAAKEGLPDTLPVWSMPHVKAHNVELPGKVSYFHACTPGWDGSARHSVLETKSETGFCRLEVTHAGYLASVSYGISEEAILARSEGQSLSAARIRALKNRTVPVDQLVGLHLSYLNGIEDQLARGRVEDLLEFLSQDWASALYHDRFGSFCRDLQGFFASEADRDLKDVVRQLTATYASKTAEELDIAAQRSQLIGPSGQALPGLAKKSIQARVVSFLRSNADLLDMYALPALRSPHFGASARLDKK
ncbi:Cilia- and flagella-associated protein 61 [Hondaea fermentalgiana]|uniref:Cilia-and flagella-associated protein 61 n=1 Tax=Hondaea fermentalgiana TaxID=2315210 RepID=A0A2R5GPW5_9STRA|nr:Cilia- and flagella-associated protein 61 [Hondaea fermentalgiana]|eukprot:GBG32900.1 Cilia- and flagella-associated protein 61 [Hondaea fermentalgiana]